MGIWLSSRQSQTMGGTWSCSPYCHHLTCHNDPSVHQITYPHSLACILASHILSLLAFTRLHPCLAYRYGFPADKAHQRMHRKCPRPQHVALKSEDYNAGHLAFQPIANRGWPVAQSQEYLSILPFLYPRPGTYTGNKQASLGIIPEYEP